MKKIVCILLSVLLLFSFAACGDNKQDETTVNKTTQNQSQTQNQTEQTTEIKNENESFDYDSIPDTMSAQSGKYEIAFVTDVGQLKDKSFNQGTWDGVKRFAYENEKSYKYYQPANGEKATDDDRYNSMKAAIDGGAEIVVCTGFLHKDAVKKAAMAYPDKNFIFIDGEVLNDDEGSPLKNVAAVDYNEEQSGFLAGYAVVKEGYRKLGFSGGGGGSNPPCNRYGYGFVQGAEAAARQENAEVQINYSWEYGSTFSASPELQTMLNGWYSNGTEVVFVAGGAMCLSAFQAAAENDAYVIGVDVDQTSQSDTVITSATKGIRESVEIMLGKYASGKWDDIGGNQTTMGAKEDALGLPQDTWTMKNFTIEEYQEIYNSIKNGEIEIDRDYENNLKQENLQKVKLNITP